jgi:hypothetical protein
VDTLNIYARLSERPENAEDKAIAHAIICKGETLGLNVDADGVETVDS